MGSSILPGKVMLEIGGKKVIIKNKKLKEREIVDGYSAPDYFTIDGD